MKMVEVVEMIELTAEEMELIKERRVEKHNEQKARELLTEIATKIKKISDLGYKVTLPEIGGGYVSRNPTITDSKLALLKKYWQIREGVTPSLSFALNWLLAVVSSQNFYYTTPFAICQYFCEKKFCTKIFPVICATFRQKILDFFNALCYNIIVVKGRREYEAKTPQVR